MTFLRRKVLERYLKVDEERALFKAVSGCRDVYARRDDAWMRLLRFSGIRLMTLQGLTVDDARDALQSGSLVVRAVINKGGLKASSGAMVGYKVFVSKRCRQALLDLLRVRRELGHAEVGDGALVMSRNKVNGKMSIRSFQLRFKHWVMVAGLSVDASPHWLRHTLGKRIMQQSTAADPRGIVQLALGHADIKSTAIYTAPDREDVARAMEEAC